MKANWYHSIAKINGKATIQYKNVKEKILNLALDHSINIFVASTPPNHSIKSRPEPKTLNLSLFIISSKLSSRIVSFVLCVYALTCHPLIFLTASAHLVMASSHLLLASSHLRDQPIHHALQAGQTSEALARLDGVVLEGGDALVVGAELGVQEFILVAEGGGFGVEGGDGVLEGGEVAVEGWEGWGVVLEVCVVEVWVERRMVLEGLWWRWRGGLKSSDGVFESFDAE